MKKITLLFIVILFISSCAISLMGTMIPGTMVSTKDQTVMPFEIEVVSALTGGGDMAAYDPRNEEAFWGVYSCCSDQGGGYNTGASLNGEKGTVIDIKMVIYPSLTRPTGKGIGQSNKDETFMIEF